MALRLSRSVIKAILGVWAALSVLIVSYTLGAHLTRLPAPSTADPALVRGLRALFPAPGPAQPALLAVHVLYDRCGCSAQVSRSLVAHGVRAGVREVVLMVADDPSSMDRTDVDRLTAARFPVAIISARDIAERLHVQAVPFLVLLDAADAVRYAGGYTGDGNRPGLQDDRVIAAVQANHDPPPLPIFGCATAVDLQKKLDPFALKY